MPTPKLETPTDALIFALEHANEMSEVFIIYRAKDAGTCTYVSNIEDGLLQVGMMEAAQLSIVGGD